MARAASGRRFAARRQQRGALLPIIVVGLLAILAAAGLAVDSSHAFLNSSRLQNALDAAALSAAKTLNETAGNTAIATAHGNEAFSLHLTGELGDAAPTVSFTFSDTLNPFAASADDPRFVRASVSSYLVPVWFASVLPGINNDFNLATTAVAGPIPLGGGQVCDVAPMLVCGDPADNNPEDGTLWGLNYGNESDLQCLKASVTGGKKDEDVPPDCQAPVDNIGPGNFQLIQLECGSGANCVRLSLAGEYQSCLYDGESVITKPGNTVGPTSQGLNTRFGLYSGPVNSVDHPPDLVSSYPLSYSEYESSYYNQQFNQSGGSPFRRVMAVPIGNCSAGGGGQTGVPVLGFGCYFMTEPTEGIGRNNWVKGHLIEDCEVSGAPGENPQINGNGYTTYKIILYNDPGNRAS